MGQTNLLGRAAESTQPSADVEAFLERYSIEVMPRTAAKVADFRDLLPVGARVYVAHIEGTPIEEMTATAARLAAEGMKVMPHFPARIIEDDATLEDWIARYQGEADVREALVLAGSPSRQAGRFDNSMQLLETGVFDKAGFERIHVAGHPEGNRDIDPDGSERNVMDALRWKLAFSERTDARMAIVTQFAFDDAPVASWADRLSAEGIDLPVHVGIAGPAKLQTLIKFAVACGVGPSLKVLKRRAMDLTRLALPYEPGEMVFSLAARKAASPNSGIRQAHFFPLGGIEPAARWVIENGGARPANAA